MGGEGGGQGQKKKKKKFACGEGDLRGGRLGRELPCEWIPPPPSWVVLSTILNVLAEKQKL